MNNPTALSNTPLLPSFTLPFYPLTLRRRYGLILHITQGGTAQKIHHELKMACSGRDSAGGYLFHLDKKQVYLNNTAPDTLLDGLADRCGKVLYPLFARVDGHGRVQGLAGTQEIRRRWQEARPALAQYYTGPVAAQVLAGMDRAVASDSLLEAAITRDWLYALLFAPVYHAYHNYEAAARVHLPLVPYRAPVEYTLQLKAAPEYTRGGFMEITATGTCTDARSLEDIVKGSPFSLSRQLTGVHTAPEGSVALTFKAYPHNGTLFSVTGSCSLRLPEGEKTVGVEVYQLGPRDPIPKKDGGPSSILAESIIVPKKKWYAFGS